MAFDNNGNLTQLLEKGVGNKFKNFIYSSENQLIKVEWFDGGEILKEVLYKYNALGHRFEKSIVDHSTGVSYKRRYLYDGQEVLAEYDVVLPRGFEPKD